jgi:hypothetical protein
MRVVGANRASLSGTLLLAALFLILSPGTQAVQRPELAGTIRDAVGSLLGDVEVLVLRERGPDPVATARTDGQGRFLVSDLPLGTYRVVAVKDGYATWLGRVSVTLRTTLDLVLQPSVADATMDADWALRVTDRSLLRETDPEALLTHAAEDSGGRGGPTVARMEADRLVQGQLDHMFAFGVDSIAGPRARMEGGDTHVLLTSHPGERAHLRFEGRKHALDAASGPDVGHRSREISDVQLAMTYDTSLDGQVAVQAFYASRESDLFAAARPSRVWGYDATWSRRLAPTSRMAVDLAYLDTVIDPDLPEGPTPLTSRALRAAARYETRVASRHDVRVRFQTRSADAAGLTLLASDPAAGPGEIAFGAGIPDPVGWAVRLDAEDAWRLTTPLTLLFALGYEADVSGFGPGRFVQQAGVQWTEADLRLDLRLARHALVDSGTEGVAPLQDPFGWSASIEFPLGAGLRLRGEALASPVREEGLDGRMNGAVLERAAYVTDGLASNRLQRVTLERDARLLRSFVQLERGEAEGTLAVVRPADRSVGRLEAQQLDFVAGRLGMRLVPTGTDVSAEYRRVLATGPLDGESVELRIAQDLVRLESRGAAWRLLLAARATQDGTAVAEGSGDGTQHWMGAGISLAF